MTTSARLALLLAVLAAVGCSRNDDKAAAPQAGGATATAESEAAAPAGGPPKLMRAGRWKTTAGTPSGEQSTTQCIGEGHDPAIEAAKAAPCGKPEITQVINGFTIELTCRKDAVTYSLAGVVKGDFETRTTSDLEMKVQAYGASKVLRLHSESVYLGPCDGTETSEPAKG